MANNGDEFLVFPVQAGARYAYQPPPVSSPGQPYQPPPMAPPPQYQGPPMALPPAQPYPDQPAPPPQYQPAPPPQYQPPTRQYQPAPPPQYQPPTRQYQPAPPPQYQPPTMMPARQPPMAKKETLSEAGERTVGVVALVIGVVLLIVWAVMKFGNEHFDFYEGFIPFIYARYPGHGWITFQSFVTPFILWAGGFAVLVGIGSFVKGDKDSE